MFPFIKGINELPHQIKLNFSAGEFLTRVTQYTNVLINMYIYLIVIKY